MKNRMDLAVDYMGLALRNPIIASSSPLTATVERIVELERAGIGAVVLKSIFEEQIAGEAGMLERFSDYPEAVDYLNAYVGTDYLAGFNSLIKEAKSRTSIPVIASINCSTRGKWIDYALKIEEAGADALELNIFFLPTEVTADSREIEEKYLEIVAQVSEVVSIPLSVKLSIRFTNILHIAQEIYNRGARGAVLYNRFFEPDIDVNTLEYTNSDWISSPKELHNSLRNVAMASGAVPGLDLSVSTGVHSGEDAVKAILAGARTVQICSTLMINGMGVVKEMLDYMEGFMDRNSFNYVSDFRGLMNSKVRLDDEVLERVQFMKYFPA